MTLKTKIMVGLSLLCFLAWVGPVLADSATYQSPNYKVDETFIGAGGGFNQSTNYSAHTAAGELGVGHVTSPNFQAYAGFNTSNSILLELNVAGGVFDLGILDQNQVKTQTTTFSVRDYLSTGYTVQILGRPPTNSGHELAAINPAASSSPGTEQFGINLAANNLSGPGPFGADPAQVPDTTFGFGQAVYPYNTSNLFKYFEGDTVANSTKSTGETLYTLSVIANASNVTPGGDYGTDLFVRVIPTF
ncbi:MAG TPA: hypothetical protein VFP35_02490 [Candidatus Saccharimonadales bacterium]|nr:hypothetical protein [Candidatus Saccharimonadales bacterium]